MATELTRDELAGALAPRAVTIVGASAKSTHTRYLIDNLTRREAVRFKGPLHLVNRGRAVIDGIQSVAATAELDAEPGLVILLIPTSECLPALEAFRRKPQGVVVYPGGAEAGQADAQEALRAWAVANRVPLIGPQSVGISNLETGLLSIVVPLRAEPIVGNVALVLQSAGLMGGMVNASFQRGIGLHSAISIGNAVVVSASRMAVHLLEEPGVKALGMYVDGIQSADELIDIASLALAKEKPMALLIGGASEAGSVAVRSHTGQLATSRRVVEGIAKQFGVVMVNDTDELLWTLEAFASTEFKRPPRGGVAVLASSGGAGIMMADVLGAANVPMPLPSSETQAALTTGRPITTFNPFDVGARSLDDPEMLRATLATLASDPAFSMVVTVAAAGLPAQEGMEAHLRQANVFVEAVRSAGKLPVLVQPVVGGSGPNARPPAIFPGVPLAIGSKETGTKVRALWLWAHQPPAQVRPTLPRSGVAGGAEADSDPTGETTVVSGPAAMKALAGLKARWPAEVLVPRGAAAPGALGGLRYPLVAKAEAGLAHRAASGGVLRPIGDERSALAAIEYLRARFDGSVSLIEEVAHDTEFVFGFQRDERYGPLLMFGMGGSDVGREVEFRSLPFSADDADRLVAPYADGMDATALATAACSLQDIALADEAISAIDLNPIVVVDHEVVVLDAKLHEVRR
jgi:acyl-CoA synthetase (NDP forming)